MCILNKVFFDADLPLDLSGLHLEKQSWLSKVIES